MPIVSKAKVTPNLDNPKPDATIDAGFRVTQISAEATRVQVTYTLLSGSALVTFVTPSAPADGATVVTQSARELVEEYPAAAFSKLVPVARKLALKASHEAAAETLRVIAAEFDKEKLLDKRSSMAVFGFVQG